MKCKHCSREGANVDTMLCDVCERYAEQYAERYGEQMLFATCPNVRMREALRDAGWTSNDGLFWTRMVMASERAV